jgi:hypothetical protein
LNPSIAQGHGAAKQPCHSVLYMFKCEKVAIMTQIETIYQNGLFKPLEEAALSENQRAFCA